MSYLRVLPRDLFNEAKLLKCLGRLALLIHDGLGIARYLELEHTNEENGFEIDQVESSGNLYCCNLFLWTKDKEGGGTQIDLSIPYNSKEAYPLLAHASEDGEDVRVFTDDGHFTTNFLDLIQKEISR